MAYIKKRKAINSYENIKKIEANNNITITISIIFLPNINEDKKEFGDVTDQKPLCPLFAYNEFIK
jgi:hypothetical protein